MGKGFPKMGPDLALEGLFHDSGLPGIGGQGFNYHPEGGQVPQVLDPGILTGMERKRDKANGKNDNVKPHDSNIP
jgi:hypothetical protein